MIRAKESVELILGVKKDPVFGSVLMVGTGGIAAELYRDRSLGLPPLTERLARRMLEQLMIWPILNGYRGRPAMNVDRLIEILMRMSYVAAERPAVEELDVNLHRGNDPLTRRHVAKPVVGRSLTPPIGDEAPRLG